MKTENLIGKVVSINDQGIRLSRQVLERVIPSVQRIIDEHEKLLPEAKFTQSTWKKLVEDDGASVCQAYTDQAENDLKNFKNEAVKAGLRANVAESLEPFKAAVAGAKKAMNDAVYSTSYDVDINVSDIVIKDGKPEINLSRIQEVYTQKIESEAQAEIYTVGKAAEEAIEKLRLLLADNGHDFYKCPWISAGWSIFPGNQPGWPLHFNSDLIKLAQ